MIEMFIKMILCHLIGDYVLQNDYIAKTKGENWYHLIVHCMLYILPFTYLFRVISWQILALFLSHIIVDVMKARYKKIDYIQDQMWHYSILLSVWFVSIVF